MNRAETALSHFRSGRNCAQSVLCAFSDLYDISEEDLCDISRGFGGGMGRMGEACGALSGGTMVLGLLAGGQGGESALKEETYRLVQEFLREFRARRESTRCAELLGSDLVSDQGRRRFHDEGLFEKVCVPCVRDAVEILEEIAAAVIAERGAAAPA